MKELSPPWHMPSVNRAGAGAGLLGQLKGASANPGKPGDAKLRDCRVP